MEMVELLITRSVVEISSEKTGEVKEMIILHSLPNPDLLTVLIATWVKKSGSFAELKTEGFCKFLRASIPGIWAGTEEEFEQQKKDGTIITIKEY